MAHNASLFPASPTYINYFQIEKGSTPAEFAKWKRARQHAAQGFAKIQQLIEGFILASSRPALRGAGKAAETPTLNDGNCQPL